MNKRLLRSSIKVLKELKIELQHDSIENSVIETLDKVITDLETALKTNSNKISAHDVLIVLGKVLEKFPAIVEAIKFLLTLNK